MEAYNSSSRDSGALFWLLWELGTYVVHRYVCRQNIHKHYKNKKIKTRTINERAISLPNVPGQGKQKGPRAETDLLHLKERNNAHHSCLEHWNTGQILVGWTGFELMWDMSSKELKAERQQDLICVPVELAAEKENRDRASEGRPNRQQSQEETEPPLLSSQQLLFSLGNC